MAAPSTEPGPPEATGDRGADGVLDLPGSGPGSRGGAPRRLGALAVDWVASLAISAAFFPDQDPAAGGIFRGEQLATLGIFALSTTVLVALLGTTLGHRAFGVRVAAVRDLGGAAPRRVPPGFRAALVRTALLCLWLPALVWDAAGRGIHDLAAGTVVVRD